jgi:hypothetical protein
VPPSPAIAPVTATVRSPVAAVPRREPAPVSEVAPVIPNVVPRPEGTMAAAVAGLASAQPPPPPPPSAPNAGAAAASKPKAGVDLAEIDRYLEGLGKL